MDRYPSSSRRLHGFHSCAKRQPSLGLTLVELLVALFIIALLAGIITPAAQMAREAARKATCQSNLRQIGLAGLQFESAFGRLPSGGWGYQWQGYSDLGAHSGQPGSWTFSLLPFVEQQQIYNEGLYNSAVQSRNLALSRRVKVPVTIYNCPSRRGSEPKGFDPACATCSLPIGLTVPLGSTTRSDYAVNAGDGDPGDANPELWPSSFWGPGSRAEAERLTQQNLWPTTPGDWTGVSWLRRGVKLSEVVDGNSHVFFAGEKHVARSAYFNGSDWGDNEPLFSGFNNDNHRSTNLFWPMMRDLEDKISVGSFGSAHHSVVNFVLLDGSVHPVSYSVDTRVYQFLGNRRDGNAIEVPE